MSAKAFHDKMVKCLDEYQDYLLLIKSNGIAVSHCSIIHEFINYLYNQHLISSIDQVSVSIANSKFYAFFSRKNKGRISKETLKKILNDFFVFVFGKYGIKNEKLMKGLNSFVAA